MIQSDSDPATLYKFVPDPQLSQTESIEDKPQSTPDQTHEESKADLVDEGTAGIAEEVQTNLHSASLK